MQTNDSKTVIGLEMLTCQPLPGQPHTSRTSKLPTNGLKLTPGSQSPENQKPEKLSAKTSVKQQFIAITPA